MFNVSNSKEEVLLYSSVWNDTSLRVVPVTDEKVTFDFGTSVSLSGDIEVRVKSVHQSRLA